MKVSREIRVRARRRSQPPALVHPPEPANAVDPERHPSANAPSPQALFTLDRQGRISQVNDRGARLLGFSGDWLVGRAFVVFIARQDVRTFIDTLVECSRVRTMYTIQLDLHLGVRTMPVQISLLRMAENPLTYKLTVVELDKIEETDLELQQSLSNSYCLLHNAPDTIFAVDPHGRIGFVNKPIWGYSINAIVGTNILDYVPAGQQPKVFRCLMQSFRFNLRSMCDVESTDDHSTRWFNFSFGTPHGFDVRLSEGLPAMPLCTTLVVREISRHKRTEEVLRNAGEWLRGFATHVDAILEEERTRVAREVHDELGQALTALKFDLEWLRKKKSVQTTEVRKKMKEMIADVDNTIERVRRISSELRPAILDDLGLIPAIEWQVTQFRKRTRIRVEFVCNQENVDISSNVAAGVFRVIQEALTNIMRHAEATSVSVKLEKVPHAIYISVADNGKGMPQHQENDLKALGIVGMEERITRLGGHFRIFSEPGRGTRVDITVPTQS
jgi:PAS domain S-box-containing protein